MNAKEAVSVLIEILKFLETHSSPTCWDYIEFERVVALGTFLSELSEANDEKAKRRRTIRQHYAMQIQKLERLRDEKLTELE